MTRKPKKVESRLILASIEIIGILFLLVGLLHSSFSLVEPVKSISFTSEKLNYNEKEPGSFKVEKSAKWIEKGKARITFDVDTVLKTKNKNVDVIFVLDNSDSMRGNKLQRVKEDSIELIDSLLANSNNKVAIISFNTDSTILSDFTNDRDSLLNIINNLNNAGATNYYRALVNVDNLLRNYVQKQDKNCIVLFLTDGYPCVEIPNEETEYKMLKRQYPYLIINGIQYEMSSEILDPIKKVSDNQYLADMGTLNNVLFDASIDPIRYEKFIITDYIDTDNFMVESIDDIKVSQGKVDFNEGEQKVTWTIELLRSGISPSMTIDVVQKEDSKVKELVSTNKRENITVTMGEVEENIESVKTPILKDTYQVIYEGNAPSGCTVTNVPDSKNYSVLDKVQSNIKFQFVENTNLVNGKLLHHM